MERFDVRRGLIKEVEGTGGLGALAKEFFDHVEDSSDKSFEASHGVMTSIEARYENGAMIVGVALETNTSAAEKLVECILKV